MFKPVVSICLNQWFNRLNDHQNPKTSGFDMFKPNTSRDVYDDEDVYEDDDEDVYATFSQKTPIPKTPIPTG